MVSPLDRKLLRDLGRMKGQAIAIGAVIGVGVLLLVMMTGLTASLNETRVAYYERYRLADVFAPVSRAPERMAKRLAALPGVADVETRVTGSALVDLQGQSLPAQALAISLPDQGRPDLNDIYLTRGRLPEPGKADEIVLLNSFAGANDLRTGDRLTATMNGVRRVFQIVGLAQSPEFLYATPPGELYPDDKRFGVIWMNRSALAAAYDMNGAFNEALLSLSRSASDDAVLDATDRLLDPYGATGAYALADQFSNRFVSEEIAGLEVSVRTVPPIFLAVAAFLLNIVVGRMVQSEREEIGLLKAFGYTNTEVGAHYFKLILVIATGGALAGCLGGIASGRAMVEVYTHFFKFPFLVFRLDPAAFATGLIVSIAAASAGGLLVVRKVFALSPAEAMRPPAPPDYSRSSRIGRRLGRLIDQPSRMVLRRITRQPIRMAGAMFGIACGMALSLGMLAIYAGFDRTVELTFSVIDRSDVTVTFTHPVSDKTLFEMRRIDGVMQVEPVRHVPAVLRYGLETHSGALTGLPVASDLYRALDAQAAPIDLPEHGVVISRSLSKVLDIAAGDTLVVEVREGHQPVLELPVAAISDTLVGAPAYMRLDALGRALRGPGRISGAHLTIDAAQKQRVFAHLKNLPTVASVSRKEDARAAIVRLMDSGAGAIRYVMGTIAFIITFGIVYNAARIAFAERARDLAALRVMGFTKAETAFVLLGELAVVTLVALPVGAGLGYGLSFAIAEGFSTELYQIPAGIDRSSVGLATTVVIGAAVVSGAMVKRELDRIDLIGVLKTRE
jgi:putative ABC transport system permease protein